MQFAWCNHTILQYSVKVTVEKQLEMDILLQDIGQSQTTSLQGVPQGCINRMGFCGFGESLTHLWFVIGDIGPVYITF